MNLVFIYPALIPAFQMELLPLDLTSLLIFLLLQRHIAPKKEAESRVGPICILRDARSSRSCLDNIA